MNFLLIDFWENVKDGVVGSVGSIVFDGLRSLCFWLDTVIYKVIIYVYNWFLMLCNGRLLDTDSNVVKTVTERCSLILGIFMFFIVAIAFLRMILDPDKITDKEIGMSSIVKKVLIVVVGLGFSSVIFDSLYDFQRVLLGNNKSGTNVIQNLFSPYVIESQDFGAVLSAQLITNFYSVNTDMQSKVSDDSDFVDCGNYNLVLQKQILSDHSFEFGYNCLNAKADVTVANSGGLTTKAYIMQFMSIESVIVGVFIVYTLIMYCIKVGVRMVQLAFLEILAPMAIISYLAPTKETMFSKWKNVYISTYIDVFIRVGIINLVVYLITIILNGWYTSSGPFWESIADTNQYTQVFMVVIMILALLTFAKRAPELLKAILPQGSAGSIGFGLGKKDNEFGFGLLGGIGAKGAGVLGGAVGGLVGGAVGGGVIGALGGALRGSVGGLKNKKLGDTLKSSTDAFSAQKNAALITAQRIAAGGSRFVLPGAQARANVYDKVKSDLEAQNSAAASVSSHISAMKDRAKSKIEQGKFTGNAYADTALSASQRLQMYQGQLNNLDRNSFYDASGVFDQVAFDKKVAEIQADITKEQQIYNTNMDKAIEEYVNAKKDAVIENERSVLIAELSNDTSGNSYAGGTSSWSALDQLDQSANTIATNAKAELAKNAMEGKKARADAQYSGKK